MSKVISLDEAVALVPDGASIGTGGVLMTRKPMALLDAIGKARRDLTLWTMLGSVDAEVLAAHDALAASNAIYVGFEQLGFAPSYSAAIADGEIDARDWSEFLFMGGLRASIAGLPFLPTRGGRGSDVTTDLNLETVRCPYTGEELAAAPAIRPDVALLHAEVADEQGNIPLPADGDFLFDYDANVARASALVIVSVERIATGDRSEAALRARGRRARRRSRRRTPVGRARRVRARPRRGARVHRRPVAGAARVSALDTADALTWSLARQCRPGDVLVNGVGTPLAIAAGLLARELLVPDLTIIVAGSVEPATHDVAEGLVDPSAVARRSSGTMGQAEMLDAIQRGDITLQFIAPAQIDGTGRINTNRVKSRRLPGPLALPDVAVLVGRLVAYRAEHSPRFLAPEVDYVTGAAGGVTRIVTGVAEIEPGEPARLASLQPGADVEHRHRRVRLSARLRRCAAGGAAAGRRAQAAPHDDRPAQRAPARTPGGPRRRAGRAHSARASSQACRVAIVRRRGAQASPRMCSSSTRPSSAAYSSVRAWPPYASTTLSAACSIGVPA